ncbi:MAG: hypothetical protein HY961_02535 [Ignavibacteriae bacterium]|nr:hypothetical protein [Ignavibacteriota bacterium]
MKRLFFVALLFVVFSDLCSAQVFGYKRQSKWQFKMSPRIGVLLSYSGVDDAYNKSVSDLLSWETGLEADAGYSASSFLWGNKIRIAYRQSHSSDKLPIKGPSIFEFTTRPVYKLFKTASSSVDLSLQGGITTAFLPETGAEGERIREFFNPASLYEGIFLHREDILGDNGQFTVNLQLGYAFQQTTYRDQSVLYDPQSAGFSSSTDNGLAMMISLLYAPVPVFDENQKNVVSFNAALDLKVFKKRSSAREYANARVESSLRTSLSIFETFQISNSIDLMYDSAISPRR